MGTKLETLAMDGNHNVCPSASGHAIYIGRTGRHQILNFLSLPTRISSWEKSCSMPFYHDIIFLLEYSLAMFDSKTRERKWNATFMDYSSHSKSTFQDYGMSRFYHCIFTSYCVSIWMCYFIRHTGQCPCNLIPCFSICQDTTCSREYSYWLIFYEFISELRHFASSSDGTVVTMDSQTGQILWSADYGAPVVAVYSLDSEGLRKLPFTSVAQETLGHLIGQLSSTEWRQRFMGIASDDQYFLWVSFIVKKNCLMVFACNRFVHSIKPNLFTFF